MKIKFTNLDIFTEVKNLQKFLDYRLINIFELSSKIFILKLTNKIEKVFIKLVSGFRFHTIDDKPVDCKQMPNTFVQKMRKHMNNKRLITITQYGLDRIVDFQFGENEYAYHIILEIYSTGNVILTDHEYKILSLQRRYKSDELDISVGQIYPKEKFEQINVETVGPNFLKVFPSTDLEELLKNYQNLDSIIDKGYRIKQSYSPFSQKVEGEQEYDDFDLMLREFYKDFDDNQSKSTKKSLNKKNKKDNKYERAKKDLTKRTKTLEKKLNRNEEIGQWIYENAEKIRPIMDKIKGMNKNHIDDYVSSLSQFDMKYNKKTNTLIIDGRELDCSVSVYANGDKYFTNKKKINVKYQKTISEGVKAVEKLKVQEKKKVEKELSFDYEEKSFWFQNFNWYMTEGFIIICGKTASQNEELVKKYMNKNNIYLHGNFDRSPSAIVKEFPESSVQKEPPLNVLLRAGDFLVCMSHNWKANRVENSYYVNSDQVSKTAPSGEYINKGSFMVRGKKNFLPESRLELGIGVLFIQSSDQEGPKFVPNPSKEDKFKSCIPICGPYIDMKNKYKFVVKLKPGRQKQGKIINGILSQFRSNKDATQLERFLIKKIKNDEWCKLIKTGSRLI